MTLLKKIKGSEYNKPKLQFVKHYVELEEWELITSEMYGTPQVWVDDIEDPATGNWCTIRYKTFETLDHDKPMQVGVFVAKVDLGEGENSVKAGEECMLAYQV